MIAPMNTADQQRVKAATAKLRAEIAILKQKARAPGPIPERGPLEASTSDQPAVEEEKGWTAGVTDGR